MNILFYLDHSVSSRFGGIERVTGQVAETLHAKGFDCYYAYRAISSAKENPVIDKCFEDRVYVEDIRKEIKDKLILWHIEAVIIQSVFDDTICLWREIVNSLPFHCKLIFAYHYNPGSEYAFLRWNNIYNNLERVNGIRPLAEWIKTAAHFPIDNIRWRRYVHRIYNLIWNNADRVVVLSQHHIKPWMKLARATDAEKFVVIPNMLSFLYFLPIEALDKKEKIVLIVSRLSEHEKRISWLLKLWKKIESSRQYDDWRLIVVGDGPDRKEYEKYTYKYLQRVVFVGKQQTEDYYRRASILMLASKQEGWGLVLTEAQQMGCVPVCLNTFPSASDIISNEKNGYLVDNMKQYEKRIKILMTDTRLRNQMAFDAIESSKRFAPKTVVEKWNALF